MTTESTNDVPFLSWSGTIAATVTVLITTLDDSVWLLPFIGTSSLSLEARWIHACTFLATLMLLALACCLVAVAVQRGVSVHTKLEQEKLEIKLEWIAVIFCWLLAIGFFIKKQLKKRRRRLQREQEQLGEQHQDGFPKVKVEYGAVSQQPPKSNEEKPVDIEEGDNDPRRPKTSQPWTVVSLTTLGFLDEISYFPALIVGDIFTAWELFFGTLFAGLIMLGIQVFLTTQCKPLIDFLDDRVPLYAIITVFAIVLTLHLVWDIVTVDYD